MTDMFGACLDYVRYVLKTRWNNSYKIGTCLRHIRDDKEMLGKCQGFVIDMKETCQEHLS